jgi:hypothetical protein
MSSERPSFDLKLDRAERHLNELKQVMGPFTARRQHLVSKREESHGKASQWVHRVYVVGEPEQRWSILAGDFLFNVRSALDHIAVAINPPALRSEVSFPILTNDPFRRDPNTRKYLQRDPSSRRNFKRVTDSVDPAARDVIKAAQPFVVTDRVDNYVLTQLSRLNNADKHRRLVVVAHGFREGVIYSRWPDGIVTDTRLNITTGHAIAHGAAINDSLGFVIPADMEMELIGTAVIAFGNGTQTGWYKAPELFDGILEIGRHIVDRLRHFVR